MSISERPAGHLVEKLTLTRDLRHLEYAVTVDISAYLVEPVTLVATWDHRPDLEPSGVACDPEMARRSLRD